MFIDMRNKTKNEIKSYKDKLIKEHHMNIIDDFFNIDELWMKIKNLIDNKQFNYFADFNDKIIIVSADITEDSLYEFICGKTKKEKEEWEQEEFNKIRIRRQKYEETIKDLIPVYKEKFQKVIENKYFDELDEIIKPCLESCYETYLLDSAYDVLERNKNNKMTNQEIEKILERHGHSGMSYSIVINILEKISDFGKDYKKYIDDKYEIWR